MMRDGHPVTHPELPEADPEPSPGASGVPPVRPPTVVGTAGSDDWDPSPVPLDLPIAESDLPRDVVDVFHRAGIHTFGDLVRDGRTLRSFGLDAGDRAHIQRWVAGLLDDG